MFTGIVEATGTVATIGHDPDRGVVRLAISTTLDVASLPLGASIAVDGVCLTVVERGAGRFVADLGPETLGLTTLGDLAPGARVHLERPLRMGDPLGGHLVAGHVDGVGTVVSRRELGGALELEIAAPPTVARVLAVKGSIAVDGVSLTINSVGDSVGQAAGSATFSVGLIPHTLAVTKLGDKPPGAPVNLEADLIAKHVEQLMAPYLRAAAVGADVSPDGIGGERPTPRREMSVEMLRRYGLVR
jgi:riboflavin synthase